MDVITLDIETYYDQDYSLSKMTTEAYVRDPRFEIIGIGIKFGSLISPIWYGDDDPGGFLKQIDFSNSAILCHNAAFDGAILSWRFDIKPKMWLDTLSMARPFHLHNVGVSLRMLAEHYNVGNKGHEIIMAHGMRRADFTPYELEKYGEYCKNDVEITHKLFRRLITKFPKTELPIIDQTIRMFTEPVFDLDKKILAEHLNEVRQSKQDLLAKLSGGKTQEEFKKILMSNPQFAALLESMGVSAPKKISKTTGKETFAFSKTDKDFLALKEHPNPAVQALVNARLGVKSTLEETRTEAFSAIAERGRLPILLNYAGAHTFRFSGGDKINLQNLPRGGKLRYAIKAPPGKTVVTADLSQIEARLLAYMAGQDDLVAAFRDKTRDPYAEFASEIYGKKIDKTNNPLERFTGKTSILGLGYYCGWAKFQHMLAIGQGGVSVTVDETEARRIVKVYRTKNHRIVALWNRAGMVLSDMVKGYTGYLSESLPLKYGPQGIELPNGMTLIYPDLQPAEDGGGYTYTSRSKRVHIYSGKLVENIVQALAQIIIKESMAKIGERYPCKLQVHDEIVCVVPNSEVEEAKEFIGAIMRTPPAWAENLPVECEIESGPSYGDTK